ncbi:hypothetical protein WJX73_002896 [Symbiochloris irregularis]|uniref:F-box domain-containing protein n=1 Tax=Symbiochloris irregularis TaxID=706552 RepID=A0AAW1P218_9CHLO
MSDPKQASFLRPPAWASLPRELLTTVFCNLDQRDLSSAERCCRSWLEVLRHPQASDLWGLIQFQADSFVKRLLAIAEAEEGVDLTTLSMMLLPACKWVADRAPGITQLWLETAYFAALTTCCQHTCQGSVG